MQTFLVSPNFSESAAVLDNKRLGKQRVECLQILKVLAIGPFQRHNGKEWITCSTEQYQPFDTYMRKTPWYNHPAVRMWRGYSGALAQYGLCICDEWISRDKDDTCRGKISLYVRRLEHSTMPPWLGNPDFHASHRSNLLRKDFAHYSQFGWTEPNNLPYVWPVK